MDEIKTDQVKSNQTTQKKRVWSLDFAKGFALIFVVVIHILDQLSSPEVQASLFAFIIYVTGRLVGAVVFMFLMGVALSLSSRANMKEGIKRGFEVMIIGYVLNFFRGTLPVWLNLQSGNLTPEDIGIYTPGFLLKEVDILPFAGLALIILATIKHFFQKPLFWVLAGSIVLLITPFVRGFTTGLPFVDIFINPLWGTQKYVYFPLFPWLAYPMFGMTYGHFLVKSENKTKFIWQSVLVGVILVALFSPILFIDPYFKELNLHSTFFQFRNTSLGAIWYTGFVLIWMAVCYLLVENTPENAVFRRLYYWSKHVTAFYCIQWIIIGWFPVDKLNMVKTILLMITIVFVTDRLTTLWNRGFAGFKKKKT